MDSRQYVVDPGHCGGECDPGAIGYEGTKEADITLKVGKRVAQLLQQYGKRSVRLTRSSPGHVSLQTRAHFTAPEDLFMSIHCNAVARRSASGFEVWYNLRSKDGKALAKHVLEIMSMRFPPASGMKNRGIKGTTHLYVLNATKCPAILVEMAFISNLAEEKKLNDPAFQEDMAHALARGLLDIGN